ncbi:MAG: NIPSNAP family protein [Chloroflexota bacterium]|nr:NIPSNAP family protein [Chloroflexota bacterium]
MATQLRDYRLAPGRLDDFIDVWRRGVRPLRERLGFAVVGAWRVDGEDRFVWLLSRPGSAEEFTAAGPAYYASPERAALDPDPAEWIVENRTSFVTDVD